MFRTLNELILPHPGQTQEPLYLPDFIGPSVDPTFDELLESLARIAQKQLKRVVESVLRWRHDQSKTMDESLLRLHLYVVLSSHLVK